MQTTRTKKMSLFITLAALAVAGASRLVPVEVLQADLENELIKKVKEKLSAYNGHLPEERVYVQLDKPMYEPGDDMWLSVYIRDGISLRPSVKSDLAYVELINPKGAVEKKITLIGKNGKAAGDFKLPEEAAGGMYKIRAYTNWMKNEGEDNVFEKEIQVQEVILPNLKMKLDFERKAFGAGDEVVARLGLNTNENIPLKDHKLRFIASLNGMKLIEQQGATDQDGLTFLRFTLPKNLSTSDGLLNVMIDHNGVTESISRSIPIVLNRIELSLFPEGGDLLSGFENTVAFRAVNEFNKPADVEGIVVDNKGRQVAGFSSFHQGMGAFRFTPEAGMSYTAKITKPVGVGQSVNLPAALDRGYCMRIDNSTQQALEVQVNTTEAEELSLVAQVRGKICYSTVIDAVKGSKRLNVPAEKFPAGVAQLTLFDAKGIARAERLVFVNKHKQMTVAVETDKERYLPREKVKMTISVKDERGIPMPAHLSLSVVNDQLLSFADDKSGNILSQLLLQQDLKEKVEEPAFYFDQKQPKADKALDYLLLTSGWRRFTWEKVLEQPLPPLNYLGQRAVIQGRVLDAESGRPLNGARIKTAGGVQLVTDENGHFSAALNLLDPVMLNATADNYTPGSLTVYNYDQQADVFLYNKNYKPAVYYYEKFSDQMAAPDMAVAAVPSFAPAGAQLEEVEIKKASSPVKRFAHGKAERPAAEAEQRDIAAPPAALEEAVVNAKEVAADRRMANFKKPWRDDRIGIQPAGGLYHRTRQFAAPRYENQEEVDIRTDFRNTIYWNPDVEIGYSGKTTIEFYASDDITSFKATVEGIGREGLPGHVEKSFFTQLPFAITTKVPLEVATEDLLSIPVTLSNNTNAPLGGLMNVQAPEGLVPLHEPERVQTIMPGKSKTVYLDYKVSDKTGEGDLSIGFKSCGLGDAFTQHVRIVPKGFPVQASFSAQDKEKLYSFEIHHLVQGSLKATFTAFPNVVSDLLKGVEGILQEPYGCFEQTSCTAYPNAMVLDYMRNTGSQDNKTLARATDLLDRGYKRLATFEASKKGYEWFGANPGHEGLTAYGIMEFTDMKRAGQDVDAGMLDRTRQWLLSHRDGKGGFAREQHAYHDFGRVSDDVLNAYIVYALAESGCGEIKKEFDASYTRAIGSGDPYLLAMMANAAYSLKETVKGNAALKALLAKQANDGSFTGASHSITYSQGQSLTIETTALAVMAMLKPDDKKLQALNDAVHFMVGARSGSGVFSSTQGTILALKALTEFAKFSKRTAEDGTVLIYVDDKKVAERSYKAGEKGTITVEGLERFIKGEGRHTLKVRYQDVRTPLPYSVAVNWNTTLPASSSDCQIDLQTRLAAKTASMGETVRLTATITNKNKGDVPSVMAIIGIPAGFTAQPWQLKELQEKQVFDYYEIKGNTIALYYRGLPAAAVKQIHFDLKAELPGEYDAPASSAYLYYTNEFKSWCAVDRIVIKKANS